MNSKDIDTLSKLPTEYLVYLINQMSESLEFINSACEASTEWLIPANDIIKIIQKNIYHMPDIDDLHSLQSYLNAEQKCKKRWTN